MKNKKNQAIIDKFLDLTDRVLGYLPAGEQIVLLQIFSNSIDSDDDTCSLSAPTLQSITGLSLPTIRKSIMGLLKRGIISTERNPRPGIPTQYKIQYPISSSFSPLRSRVACEPIIPLSSKKKSILDNLTEEGLSLIDRTYRSLDKTDMAKYKKLADESTSLGCDKDVRIRELIAEFEFNPDRLRSFMKDKDDRAI